MLLERNINSERGEKEGKRAVYMSLRLMPLTFNQLAPHYHSMVIMTDYL